MSTSNVIWGSDGDQFLNSSVKTLPFGAVMKFTDGREFTSFQCGGTATVAGYLYQQAAVTSGHTKDIAVAAAAAAGDTSVTITNSTTAITANMYAEGFMFVNDEAGKGYLYKIKSHPAEATGSGSCVLTLEEGSALVEALTTSSEVGLRKHICDEVVIAPTTETGVLVGLAVTDVTANYYGWLQTKGMACVATNGTIVLSEGVTRSLTTPGAVDPYNGDGTGNMSVIGTVQSVSGSGEFSLINLNIV